MRRRGVALAVVLAASVASPALAWEPAGPDDRRPELPPAPPALVVDPAPFIAPPPGIYYVTDTYVADVVTASGLLTTYSTTTVHESTGSYARVLETVATGIASAYDGDAFNGRHTLADGRRIAGTFYENYILTSFGFVPVSVVFFQDDSELRRLATAAPPMRATARPSVASASTPPSARTCCASSGSAPLAVPTPVPQRIRPGLSVTPASAPLAHIEVLRGRPVILWPRAFVGDREIAVRGWTVVAGDAGETFATSGSAGAPFRTSWSRLAPPGGAYDIVFRLEVDAPEGGRRSVESTIAVVVRSPALDE